MAVAVQKVDDEFGINTAKQTPELVGYCLLSEGLTNIAQAIESLADAIRCKSFT